MQNSNSKPNQQNSHEIDLIQLIASFGRTFKQFAAGIARVFIYVVIFAIKKTHFILAFALTGLVIGWFCHPRMNPIYSSECVIELSGVNPVDMANYINRISRNAVNKEKALDIDRKLSNGLKTIKAYQILDINNDEFGDLIDYSQSYDPIDTTRKLSNRLAIVVELNDTSIFPEIKKGFLNYLSSDPYLEQSVQIRKKELLELLEQIDMEISKLDQEQKQAYIKIESIDISSEDEKQGLILQSAKHSSYLNKLQLIHLKYKYLKELEMIENTYTIVSDFSNLVKKNLPRKQQIIRTLIVITLIGFLILLVFFHRQQIIAFANFDKPKTD